MAIRGKGEGTIYCRNGKWIAQYYNNEKKRKTISGKTRKEVQKKLVDALKALNDGTYIDTPKVLFGVHVKEYMENYKINEIQRTTYDSYREYLQAHFYNNDLANIQLSKVTVDIMQRYYNSKTKSGLSSRTVRYLYSILNGALENARKRHLILENPNRDVTLPRKVKKEICPPSDNEIRLLLKELQGHKLYGLFRLYIFYGLRRSEALAIQKKNINWETGEIKLQYSLGYIINDGIEQSRRKHIYVLKEDMKNKTSKGSIYVDKETLQALKLIIDRQTQEKKENIDIYENTVIFISSDNRFSTIKNDLLFTKSDGRIIPGREILDELHKVMEKCNIEKKRVHDLRHFFASSNMKLTKDIKLVSELCRHKQVSTTAEIYLHCNAEEKIDARDKYIAAIMEE